MKKVLIIILVVALFIGSFFGYKWLRNRNRAEPPVVEPTPAPVETTPEPDVIEVVPDENETEKDPLTGDTITYHYPVENTLVMENEYVRMVFDSISETEGYVLVDVSVENLYDRTLHVVSETAYSRGIRILFPFYAEIGAGETLRMETPIDKAELQRFDEEHLDELLVRFIGYAESEPKPAPEPVIPEEDEETEPEQEEPAAENRTSTETSYTILFQEEAEIFPTNQDMYSAGRLYRSEQETDLANVKNEKCAVTVTQRGFRDEYYVISFYLENYQKRTLSFTVEAVSFNGKSCDAFWGDNVDANKNIYSDLYLTKSQLDEIGVSDPDAASISFTIKATDTENWINPVVMEEAITF